MTEPYDSRPDTLAHIDRVRELMAQATDNLKCRAAVHDASKLAEPELSAFDRVGAARKFGTARYGTPDYAAALLELGPALEHHYQHNDHHPQHYAPLPDTDEMTQLRQSIAEQEAFLATCNPKYDLPVVIDSIRAKVVALKRQLAPLEWERSSFSQMSFLSLLEMLADWKAAGERTGMSMRESLDINRQRFGISPQLFRMMENTAQELGWI